MYIGKHDATLYKEQLRKLDELPEDLTYSSLHSKGEFTDEVIDHPNEIEKDNKNHMVLYTVVVYAKDGSISSNKIWYKQDDIGMSTDEIILIVLSVIFFVLSGLLIWRGVINLSLKKREDGISELTRKAKDPKAEKLILYKAE